MKTLKQEEVNAAAYRDLAHAEAEIGSFIEQIYNRQRGIVAPVTVNPITPIAASNMPVSNIPVASRHAASPSA